MQKLLVLQSMWAMERRHTDGREWSLDEKLTMIRDAGFDGVSVGLADRETAARIASFVKAHGMIVEAMCYPATLDELKPTLERVAEFGANHVNLQPNARPYRLEDCIPLLEGWRRLGEEAGVKVFIETHRDRMTTDLFFTLHLLDCFPDMKLTADLSHFLVGREFAVPVSAENHAYMHRVLDNSWAFHGRVASREQVQVEISFPCHKPWVDLFMDWWGYGFRSWRRRAAADDVLSFTCELGPKPYAIVGRDGNDLSDRWQEALQMKDMIRELWARSVEARAA
jgi:hypothetical protein